MYDYITDDSKNPHERIYFLELEDEYWFISRMWGIIFEFLRIEDEHELIEALKQYIEEISCYCMKDGTDKETAKKEAIEIFKSLCMPLMVEEKWSKKKGW